ncbi:MAG: hypothetical protein ABIH23_08390 [bacterium]
MPSTPLKILDIKRIETEPRLDVRVETPDGYDVHFLLGIDCRIVDSLLKIGSHWLGLEIQKVLMEIAYARSMTPEEVEKPDDANISDAILDVCETALRREDGFAGREISGTVGLAQEAPGEIENADH